MKKRKFYQFIVVLAAIAIWIFSCEKEDLKPQKELMLKIGTVQVDQEPCDQVCIDLSLQTPLYFPKTYQDIVSWGGPSSDRFSKTVDLQVYNTETHFVIVVKSTEGWSDLVIDDESSWIDGPVDPNVWGTLSLLLPEGWQACDDYSFTLQVTGGGGPPAEFDVSYDLIGICGCDYEGNEFTGEAESCDATREAIYTFASENGEANFKIQGGLTNFTGDNATVYINDVIVVFDETSADGWMQGTTIDGFVVGQRTPGQSTNRNIRVEGGLEDCSGVVIRILWDSTNPGGVITGEWTVKNGDIELAPEVAGLECS